MNPTWQVVLLMISWKVCSCGAAAYYARLILLGFETGWEILLKIIAVLMIQWECRSSQQLLDSNKNWMINCNLCYCNGFCCQCKEKPNLKTHSVTIIFNVFISHSHGRYACLLTIKMQDSKLYEMLGGFVFFLFSVGTWAQVPKSLWTCRKSNLPVLLRNKGNFIWPVILQTTAWKLWKKVGDAFLSTSFFSEGI